MRIKEEFKRSGFFWLPSTPERQVPGILSISDGGDVKLELAQALDISSLQAIFGYSPDDSLSQILGYVEKGGPVIIDRCYHMSKKRNIAHGGLIASDVILAKRAFISLPYTENTNLCFNTVTFSVEGIDEWVGISGIEVDRQFERSALTISYNRPENVTINLENGMQLQIVFAWTFPGMPAIKSAEVTQKVYFKLISQNPYELDTFFSIAEKITAFLCFIMNQIVCLEEMTATSDNLRQDIGSGRTAPIPVEIYCSSWPYSKDEPEIDELGMLFGFNKIHDHAESIINKWIESYDQVVSAFDLYFLTKTGRVGSMDLQFLTMVQALEAFHRRTSKEKHMDEGEFKEIRDTLVNKCPKKERGWFAQKLNYANQLTLGNRLERMTEPFNNFMGGEYRLKLIRSIVDTRNYLTHLDPDSEHKAAKGRSLEFLIDKIDALFQLHFLKLIGFNEEEIRSIVSGCSRLKDQCSMIDEIYTQT